MFSLPYIPLRTQMPAPSRNAAFISHSCPPHALGLPPRRVTFQFINSIKEKSFGGKAVLEVEGGDQWLMGQSGLSLFLVNREQIALQPPIFTSRQRRRKGQRKFWTVVSLLHLSLQVTKANQELLGTWNLLPIWGVGVVSAWRNVPIAYELEGTQVKFCLRFQIARCCREVWLMIWALGSLPGKGMCSCNPDAIMNGGLGAIYSLEAFI